MKRLIGLLLALAVLAFAAPVHSKTVIINGVVVLSSPIVYGDFLPLTDDAFDLGSSSKEWKDLYVDGTANIDSLGVNTAAPQSLLDVQGDAGAAGILTLATKELTIVAADELGRINFNAPLESSGTDAILPGASIWAVAEDTFAADNNKTALVFATGASGAAAEAMRVDSSKRLQIGDASAGAGNVNIKSASAIWSLAIDQDYNAKGIDVDSEATSSISINSTGYTPFYGTQDITGGLGLYIRRNINEAGTNPLVTFYNQHTNNTQATFLLDHNGTGGAQGFALHADSENVAAPAIQADSPFVALNANGPVAHTPSNTTASPATYANDASIVVAFSIVRVAGNGAAVILDTDPAIADGKMDGQDLKIQGCSDANTVQIADACNTQLEGGVAFTLGLGDILYLTWDAGGSLWREVSRSDN